MIDMRKREKMLRNWVNVLYPGSLQRLEDEEFFK